MRRTLLWLLAAPALGVGCESAEQARRIETQRVKIVELEQALEDTRAQLEASDITLSDTATELRRLKAEINGSNESFRRLAPNDPPKKGEPKDPNALISLDIKDQGLMNVTHYVTMFTGIPIVFEHNEDDRGHDHICGGARVEGSFVCEKMPWREVIRRTAARAEFRCVEGDDKWVLRPERSFELDTEQHDLRTLLRRLGEHCDLTVRIGEDVPADAQAWTGFDRTRKFTPHWAIRIIARSAGLCSFREAGSRVWRVQTEVEAERLLVSRDYPITYLQSMWVDRIDTNETLIPIRRSRTSRYGELITLIVRDLYQRPNGAPLGSVQLKHRPYRLHVRCLPHEHERVAALIKIFDQPLK